MRKIKIIKLAAIERAQDKIYPAGCTLIPLSASAPELVRFLETASAVENRFAVVIPNEKVIPEFLFITVQRASARFFHTYQTGINLQFNTLLKYFKVEFTDNKERQSEIVEAVRKCDQIALKEELAIGVLKEIKRNMLQRMFP